MKPDTEYIVAALRAIGYHKRPDWTWDSRGGMIRIRLRPLMPDSTIAMDGWEIRFIDSPYGLALKLFGQEILDRKRKPKDVGEGQLRFLTWLDKAVHYDLSKVRWDR